MQNNLISRNKLQLSLKRNPSIIVKGKQFIRLDAVLEKVRIAPTIDAVPVVHGRWVYGVTLNHEWRKCSECLVSQEIFGCFTYCPNCGAKMDGGSDNEG